MRIACTISGTLQDGTLHLYNTHVSIEDDRPVYNTNIIFTRNLGQDPELPGEGIAAVRNVPLWGQDSEMPLKSHVKPSGTADDFYTI